MSSVQIKTLKPCVTGFCEGNSLVTGESPAQRASNVENVSILYAKSSGRKSLPALYS